jgi:hypothetical protein
MLSSIALCFITTKNETSTQRLYFNKQENRSEYKVEIVERKCYLKIFWYISNTKLIVFLCFTLRCLNVKTYCISLIYITMFKCKYTFCSLDVLLCTERFQNQFNNSKSSFCWPQQLFRGGLGLS